jgi:hypothetical protein
VAWLATGWLLFTPHFWLGAEKELSDVPTLALHLAVIGCGWRGLWSWKWRTLATALVAVGLGFRVQNGAAFLPPWLLFTMLSLWTDPGQKGVSRMARTAWTLATQFTVLGGICALWFGGMLYLAGGWSPLEQAVEYHTAFLFQSENTMGISGGFHLGWWATRVALHANSFLLAAFGVALRLITRSNALILWGPGLAAVIVVGLALWRARSPQAIAALLWALPHFILEVLVFQPSNVRYALPLLPPVILFASAGVALWRIPRPVKLLIVAPLAIWLVFISSWCIRTLRTVRSPLVASVDWVFDGDHGSPGWGSGRVNVRGEVHRLAEYRYPLRHFDYIYERAAGAAGRVDVVVVAPPESDWFYTDSLSVDAGEFERSFIVHPKHSHLRAEIYDIHRPRPGS